MDEYEYGANERGYVYFIYAPHTRKVKIGKTIAPKKRFDALTHMSSDTLVLVYLCEVSNALGEERKLHNAFKRWRRNGEWFELAPSIVKYLRLKLGVFDPEQPKAVPFLPRFPVRRQIQVQLPTAQLLPKPPPQLMPYRLAEVLEELSYLWANSRNPLRRMRAARIRVELPRVELLWSARDYPTHQLLTHSELDQLSMLFKTSEQTCELPAGLSKRGTAVTALCLAEAKTPDEEACLLLLGLVHDWEKERPPWVVQGSGLAQILWALAAECRTRFPLFGWHHKCTHVFGDLRYDAFVPPTTALAMALLLDQIATHLASKYVLLEISFSIPDQGAGT